MEFIFAILVIVAVLAGLASPSKRRRGYRPLPPRKRRKPTGKPPSSHVVGETIIGPAYVVDGDTIIVQRINVRLFGIDAPEMEDPYGRNAKAAMFDLCRGHDVTVHILDTDGYGRTVANCYLPDGRDLSAEMVKQGHAIDWPKFSGGHYGQFEQPGIRKRLWRCDALQKGRMPSRIPD